MKILNTILLSSILALIFSCSKSESQKENSPDKRIKSEKLQSIIDSSALKGVILIFDPANNLYYSNDFQEANKSVIPASTYKIPHSIIGLETKILKDEKTIFEWDGNDRALSIWEKDLSLKEAFQRSCVPCYQGLARKIGPGKMKEHLAHLNFGLMDVHEQNIDNFWLIGKSKINNFEQINFLKRLYNHELNIAKSTGQTVKRILKIEESKDFTLSGKTGLGINPNGNIGWFVGYVEKENKVYYFATRITPIDDDMPRTELTALRKEITMLALEELNIIE